MTSVGREPASSPVIFKDHGWRRYNLVVLVFSAAFGFGVLLIGIAFIAVSGSKDGPPPILGAIFLVGGGVWAWFGVRLWRVFRRRAVAVYTDRIEVNDGRSVTTVPVSNVDRFECRPSDAFQMGLAQRVILLTKEGQVIQLPLLGRAKNAQQLIEELQRTMAIESGEP